MAGASWYTLARSGVVYELERVILTGGDTLPIAGLQLMAGDSIGMFTDGADAAVRMDIQYLEEDEL